MAKRREWLGHASCSPNFVAYLSNSIGCAMFLLAEKTLVGCASAAIRAANSLQLAAGRARLSPSFRLGLNGEHGPAAHTEEKEPLAPNPNDRCADETHRLAATLTFHAWTGVLLDGGGL
jgi:hypothetical protein